MLVGRLNSLSAAIVGLILGVLFVLAAAGPAAAQVQPISADAGGVLEFTYDAPIAAVEVRTADFAPVVAPFVATRRSALGPSGQHGNLYDSAADFVAPRALPAFSRSSIDDAVTSVSRAHNDQISVGARAIDKRLGANSAP
ncbi:MAG: hypothetical protein GY701_16475, partial [Sulfitobacter sp.]|nr:hypothetical protein [Sulfitobacter sp.]